MPVRGPEMRCILLGVLASSFDLAALKGIPYLKQVIGLAAALLFDHFLVMVAFYPAKFRLPAWLPYVSWLFQC